ncbi:uncharacterized protein LOC130757455 [Actinidia eriantha]|uniref:uncharacterized protein LOC130757455 n=1 Tax=Actinidia eriantha TaxID=165200 RepID=UPI002589751D|nr:uncharacterized protein LOC130757455 [Actinidia eriantha]
MPPRTIYLVDYACFQPPYYFHVPFAAFLEYDRYNPQAAARGRQVPNEDPQAVQTGLGDRSPSSMHYLPPESKVAVSSEVQHHRHRPASPPGIRITLLLILPQAKNLQKLRLRSNIRGIKNKRERETKPTLVWAQEKEIPLSFSLSSSASSLSLLWGLCLLLASPLSGEFSAGELRKWSSSTKLSSNVMFSFKEQNPPSIRKTQFPILQKSKNSVVFEPKRRGKQKPMFKFLRSEAGSDRFSTRMKEFFSLNSFKVLQNPVYKNPAIVNMVLAGIPCPIFSVPAPNERHMYKYNLSGEIL